MTPSSDAPLRVVSMSVVADIEPTSRFEGGDASADTAHITATLELESADADLVFPVRATSGTRSSVALTGGATVVRVRSEVTVVPDDSGQYRLTLQVPDPPELIELAERAPVSVLVLLPALTGKAGAELVDWTREKNPTVYGADRGAGDAIANRPGVAWQFDDDPSLDVVWRYVGGSG